jgi:O-antigen/teichoic acid export membrane protein
LARGTIATIVAQVVRIVAGVLMVPLVIGTLGLQGYGTWVILMALYQQLGAPTTGFQWAYSKFTAELEQSGDLERLSGILAAGLITLSVPTALVGAGLWFASDSLLPLLGVPENLHAATAAALALLSLAALLRAAGGGALQVLAGLQRTDLRYSIDVLDAVVYLIVAVVLLLAGWGLVALATGILLGQALSLLAGVVACKRVYPAISLSPLRARADGFREILGLGARFQVMVVLGQTATSGRAMAIGAVAGADVVGLFGLAERLIIMARTPANSIVTPLLPAFASLTQAADQVRRHRLRRLGSKLSVASVLPVLAFICLLADPLLFAWTGQHYPQAVIAVWVLSVTSLAITATAVPEAQLRAAGTLSLETRMLFAEAVLMVAGAVAGFAAGGFVGILVAVLCIRVGTRSWFLVRFDAEYDNGLLRDIAGVVARSTVATLPALIVLFFAGQQIFADSIQHTRIEQLAWIGALGVVFIALTTAASAFTLFTAEERYELVSLLRKGVDS